MRYILGITESAAREVHSPGRGNKTKWLWNNETAHQRAKKAAEVGEGPSQLYYFQRVARAKL